MKVQSVVAVVASAAVVSAAPGAVRQGSVAKRAPVLVPMYPSNCTDFTVDGHSNCTKGPGSPPTPSHDHPEHPHQSHDDGNPFTNAFDFIGGLLKSLVGGGKHEKRSMEPVYIL